MLHNYSKDSTTVAMIQPNPEFRPNVMSPEGEQIGEVVSIDVNDDTGNEPVALDSPLGTEFNPEDQSRIIDGPFFHQGSVTSHPAMTMKVKIDSGSEIFKKIEEGANMSVSMSVSHEANALINIKYDVI